MGKEILKGLENAPLRALYKSMGFANEQMEKPTIAIISCYAEDSPENAHLKNITDSIKCGILENGGLPFVVPAISVGGAMSTAIGGNKFELPSRELICDSIESVVCSNSFDAMILVCSSDDTIASMLMVSARINIPTIIFTGGVMIANNNKTSFTKVCEGAGQIKTGKITINDFSLLEENVCVCPGSINAISGIGMSVVCEALGMTVSSNATTPAVYSEKLRLARQAGKLIVQLYENQLTPKKIMTIDSLKNAFAVNFATCNDTNVIIHLLALANELGIDYEKHFSYDKLSELAKKVPLLINYNDNFFVEDINSAGGILAVTKELSQNSCFSSNCLTVYGSTFDTLFKDVEIKDNNIIYEFSSGKKNLICFGKGNLSEDGAILKKDCDDKNTNTSFKAKVFCNEEDAVRAVLSGDIEPKDAVVINFQGVKGAPGMPKLSSVCFAIAGMGLSKDVAIVTDARISALCKCLAVCHISPEAQEGGTLAIVCDGDSIIVDVAKGKIALDVPSKEIQTRMKKLKLEDKHLTGYLLRYANLAKPADKGAVFKTKF